LADTWKRLLKIRGINLIAVFSPLTRLIRLIIPMGLGILARITSNDFVNLEGINIQVAFIGR
jgi:hypothetical protein